MVAVIGRREGAAGARLPALMIRAAVGATEALLGHQAFSKIRMRLIDTRVYDREHHSLTEIIATVHHVGTNLRPAFRQRCRAGTHRVDTYDLGMQPKRSQWRVAQRRREPSDGSELAPHAHRPTAH